MERTLVLGVDAGSANVVATLAELAEGVPLVIGVGMVPCSGLHRGMVTDLAATAEAMGQAVSKACEMAGRSGVTQAVISVSGPHIQSVLGTASVPVRRPINGVTPEDQRRVLDAATAAAELPAGCRVMHVVPRTYQLDGLEGIADPLGMAGRSLSASVHLITGEELPVQNYLNAAARAGLQVADFQLGVLAAGEAVLSQEEREAGVLLLQIGAGTTGVAVYDRGHLWHVSVLPVGGEHITSDIATLLRVPVSEAEELKIERGWAATDQAPDTMFELPTPSGKNVREVTDKQLAEIIESRVQEILQLAAAQVKRSGYTGLFPAGLVLTGGGARLNGLVEVAADCLGLPARLGCPSGPLVEQPEFATAAGLIRWGKSLAEDEAAVTADEEKRDNWGRLKNWLRGLFG